MLNHDRIMGGVSKVFGGSTIHIDHNNPPLNVQYFPDNVYYSFAGKQHRPNFTNPHTNCDQLVCSHLGIIVARRRFFNGID